MIEVILRDHIEHLGRRGDIVKVASGYARNYLLPRKLALAVTESNRRLIEHEKKIAVQKEAEEQLAAQALASELASLECIVARKVGETDTLYGSVTSGDIAEFLAGRQHVIDKRKILLAEPIKQLGETFVPIRLHRDVTAQLKVVVVKEEE